MYHPALRSQLPERVHFDGELFAGGHQLGSARKEIMETLLIGVKARVMPTIDLVVQVPAGMAVAEALHLLRQPAPHGPWP